MGRGLMMGNRTPVVQQQRTDHRWRDKLGVMAFLPIELLPDWRDFAIVLKISEGVVPVAWQGDLFAGKPAAIFQSALADDGLQARHAEIGAQREIVLPGAD